MNDLYDFTMDAAAVVERDAAGWWCDIYIRNEAGEDKLFYRHGPFASEEQAVVHQQLFYSDEVGKPSGGPHRTPLPYPAIHSYKEASRCL
jgi:hypothetical protein